MGGTCIRILSIGSLLAVVSIALADTTTSTTVTSTTTTTTIETSTTSTTEPSTTSTTVLVTTTSTSIETTTSTSTTVTTTTSTSSTTSTSTSTTSTTSTSLQVCACDGTPFMAQNAAKMSSGVQLNADLGVNETNGVAIFARDSSMADGTKVSADRVKLATGADVWDIATNALRFAPGASFHNVASPLPLPLVAPFCNIPDELECGTGEVVVVGKHTQLTLMAGDYARVSVGAGATLWLPQNAPYRFCEMRISNGGTINAMHQITIDVPGNVIIGNEATLRTSGGAPLRLRVGGTKVLLGRAGLVTAAVMAPNAKAKIKTSGVFEGCLCAQNVKAAKDATLSCSGDASPSGAFVD